MTVGKELMSVRPHVSFSEWQLWQECQWRWMRDYREERRSSVYSSHLEFGKAVHDALEKFKDPEAEKNPTVEETCAIFEEKFRTRYLKVRDRDKKPLTDGEVEDWVLAGHRIIENLHHCEEPESAEVLFVEYPLMEKIARTDDVEVKFKGYIDLVIKTKDKRGNSIVYIVDYKTCSWGWPRAKRQDERLASQIRLYKHFFSKRFKLDPKNVRTAFVLLKRTPSRPEDVAEFLPVSAGPKTVMRAVDGLNRAVTGMQSNDYKKNRDACVNPFGDVCPYYDTVLCLND